MDNKNHDPARIKLTRRQRFDYAVYDMGYMFIYYWINAFLTIYYTDVVGVDVAMVATMIFVVRIFDAVNDPILGSLTDRTKSRHGKYKPWIRWGGIAMAIFIVMLFRANPDWNYTTKIVWMWVTYILVTVASTCNYMPYLAMNGILTSDPEERNKLSALRQVLVNFGGQGAAILAVPLIMLFAGTSEGPAAAKGYANAVLLAALIFVPICIYTSVRTKEVVTQVKKEKKQVPIRTSLVCFVKNKYAIILAIGFLMFGVSQYGRMSMVVYYFQYVAKDLNLNTYAGIITLIAAFLGSGIGSNWLYSKTRNKGKAMAIAFVVYGILTVPMYFISAHHIMFWILLFITQFSCCVAGGISYGVAGDAADFGEYKFGVRADGLIAAIVSLFQKTGAAIGPAIMLFIIDQIGFIPNAETQPQPVLNVMTSGISIMLSMCSVVAVIVFALYDLDEKRLIQIREELQSGESGFSE